MQTSLLNLQWLFDMRIHDRGPINKQLHAERYVLFLQYGQSPCQLSQSRVYCSSLEIQGGTILYSLIKIVSQKPSQPLIGWLIQKNHDIANG